MTGLQPRRFEVELVTVLDHPTGTFVCGPVMSAAEPDLTHDARETGGRPEFEPRGAIASSWPQTSRRTFELGEQGAQRIQADVVRGDGPLALCARSGTVARIGTMRFVACVQ